MNAVAQKQEQAVRPKQMPHERDYITPSVDIITPSVDIFETQDGFVLEAEMPGVNKDGLEITLENNVLTLIGRREGKMEVPDAELLYRESRPADYRRVFELDPTIDRGKISARMEQGVLNLTLPKAEQVKPRKITVE